MSDEKMTKDEILKKTIWNADSVDEVFSKLVPDLRKVIDIWELEKDSRLDTGNDFLGNCRKMVSSLVNKRYIGHDEVEFIVLCLVEAFFNIDCFEKKRYHNNDITGKSNCYLKLIDVVNSFIETRKVKKCKSVPRLSFMSLELYRVLVMIFNDKKLNKEFKNHFWAWVNYGKSDVCIYNDEHEREKRDYYVWHHYDACSLFEKLSDHLVEISKIKKLGKNVGLTDFSSFEKLEKILFEEANSKCKEEEKFAFCCLSALLSKTFKIGQKRYYGVQRDSHNGDLLCFKLLAKIVNSFSKEGDKYYMDMVPHYKRESEMVRILHSIGNDDEVRDKFVSILDESTRNLV